MAGILVNSMGKIEIADDVIAKLAGMAAMECYGVVGMASIRATDGIADLLKLENLDKGVKVRFEGNAAVIELSVVVEYGISISTVATNVIDAVKYSLESQTGLSVASVNVSVASIRV